MKIAIEKVRNDRGDLVDLVPVDGDTIFDAVPSDVDQCQCRYVQVIDGKPVRVFTAEELLVIELS